MKPHLQAHDFNTIQVLVGRQGWVKTRCQDGHLVAALRQRQRDLREMLRLQPDSALTLNALGYSLTNLTDRHQEALVLIRRALELQPEDPAILDSMGWVHFRLGDYTAALGYLRDAYQRFPDHEVAAHLGEVLWVSGAQAEARAIWQKALEAKPDSPIITEAMRRLGATPSGS